MNNCRKPLLPALVAVGGGLATAPAAALELGDLQVESQLGQPLRASVAYALAPNESLAGYCVSLNSGPGRAGLPGTGGARITVADGRILIRGYSAVREPVVTVRLDVNCPYTPAVSREFLLLVDPAPAAGTTAQADLAPAMTRAGTAAPREARRPAAQQASVTMAPIDAAGRYLVQPGDSISRIAQRIGNRDVGLWATVRQLVATNPDAFVDGDPDRLIAGSRLVIPDFVPLQETASVATAASEPAAAVPAATVAAPAVDPSAASIAYTGHAVAPPAEPPEPAPVETAMADTAPGFDPDLLDDTEMLEPADAAPLADLKPGDVIIDTSLPGPETASGSPNPPVANIVVPREPEPVFGNWLLWLIGAGVALVAGVFAFRRRDAESASRVSIQAAHPMRGQADGDTEQLESSDPLDYEIADDSPTEENLALDADLALGTGLDDTGDAEDIDVAQDFAFAMTTALDLELPEEMSSGGSEKPETDIIPPLRSEISSILESEVLPEDDDYDMSVIMDATKMPQPEDVTERDLKAVPLDGDDTRNADEYTLNQEADYKILEQDYEEELTATQALNKEIEKAAAEIAERMEHAEQSAGDTAAKPLASVTELDVTANMRRDANDADATDINEALDLTDEISAEDKTVEMPSAENDDDATESPSADAK